MSPGSISISSSFTAEPIGRPLANWLRELDLPYRIEFAPYGHVIHSLLDSNSQQSANQNGINVVLLRLEDWAHEPGQLADRGSEFCNAVTKFFASGSPCGMLVCFCPPSPHATQQVRDAVSNVERQICERLQDVVGVSLVTADELTALYPVSDYFDPVTNQTAHIPYSRSFFTALASMIARRFYVSTCRPAKVIVLDCDNTLWQGVCGEVGTEGVVVGPAHQRLQQEVLRLREQGFLLALCSKNNERDVWDIFENHPGMVLQKDHIAAWEINWEPKSENLRRLAGKLSLGIDSLVFLDDSPVEIGEVIANCGEAVALTVPELDSIADFIRHVWVFDRLRITSEDRRRADAYRIEQRRDEERGKSKSLRQFLRELQLRTSFVDVDDGNIERVSQLTHRTNQFNFTLGRHSSAELRQILDVEGVRALGVEVSDKFGDYGLVGFMLCRDAGRLLRVEEGLLSCRALGRGVEHRMLRHVGQMASELGFDGVSVAFTKGPRNQPAAAFLESLRGSTRPIQRGDVEFRFSRDQLLQIDPYDIERVGQARVASGGNPGQAESRQADSLLLSRIANDFRTVEQISERLSGEVRPRPELEEVFVRPGNEIETKLSQICCDILHFQDVGVNDSLKDLGCSSLHIVQIHSQIVQRFGVDLSITDLYTLPSIRAIAQRLRTQNSDIADVRGLPEGVPKPSSGEKTCEGIAVIGMAGRFPGADDVSQFWDNLVNGVNCIREIPEEELNLAPESPLRRHPNLVRKSAAVKDADKFDARFFGIFPKEAQLMDPQHRLMLECCWHALEDAGYCPDQTPGSVGVFAGCYMDTYILASLGSNPKLLASLANSFHGGDLLTELGNDKDYLATRISFLLNLCGPSITVQTACSTSLVAIIQACQALETGQCDMALAGGSTLKLPQNRGYLYADGGMVSPDGVCRTFDADARGTVFGEGAGAVLLKRVEDAVADGDDIYGVIRGWGINNDGRSKMGYTAPSVDGQSAAIRAAHRRASISADTITYMEAHGTGTSLGDPIEVDALTRAFRITTDRKQFCGIGSVKSNIGHLDVAAGVTGLIKNCLAIRHGLIPPSINFSRPNPNIDFENSPFYVVTEPTKWEAGAVPRRAGLSSFGVGGTNAHIVIEEPPPTKVSQSARTQHTLILSARSQDALATLNHDLAEHLENHPNLRLPDVAFTLQTGRKTFNYTRVLSAPNIPTAIEMLRSADNDWSWTHREVRRDVPVAFMFPGQGSQHPQMARGLYETDSVFRLHFDECCELLRPQLGFDLKEKIFSDDPKASDELNQTTLAQPAIFAVSYSLAKRLEHIGIVPERMIGHSVGEFVAACLAGVFTLADALKLIVFRAEHMQQMPGGDMMAVRLTEDALSGVIGDGVELAAINGPALCIVAGPSDSVESVRRRLEADDVVCQPLHTSHAFHSALMDPVIEPFAEALRDVNLKAPSIEIISSVTGELLSPADATDAMYWAEHLRKTVRFTDALHKLLDETESTLLEVGPGRTLSTLARQHPSCAKDRVVLSSLPHVKLVHTTERHFAGVLGRLWQAGSRVRWSAFYENEQRTRLHLPTYPFERQRYWFDEAIVDFVDPEVKDESAVAMTEPNAVVPISEEPATCIAQAGGDDLTRMVVQQQLHIMKQQLEAWRN